MQLIYHENWLFDFDNVQPLPKFNLKYVTGIIIECPQSSETFLNAYSFKS